MFQVPGRPRSAAARNAATASPDVDVVAGLAAVAVDGRPVAGQQPGAEDRARPRTRRWGPAAGRTRWPAAGRCARCRAAGCTGPRTARRSTWPCRRATRAAAARPPSTGSARPARTGRRRWSRTAPAPRPPAPPPARSPCPPRWSARPPAGAATLARTSICAARWQISSGASSVISAVSAPAVGDAQLVQRGALVQPPRPPGGQVIDHRHLVPAGQQGVGQMGADEAGTAGHEYAHG